MRSEAAEEAHRRLLLDPNHERTFAACYASEHIMDKVWAQQGKLDELTMYSIRIGAVATNVEVDMVVEPPQNVPLLPVPSISITAPMAPAAPTAPMAPTAPTAPMAQPLPIPPPTPQQLLLNPTLPWAISQPLLPTPLPTPPTPLPTFPTQSTPAVAPFSTDRGFVATTSVPTDPTSVSAKNFVFA
ncbi:ORF122 [Anguillid herpesvirus 1]|uniref:Protein ORF122 n=1 Tax=Anguillid herpesvirus 1 TaxID=150286 RepID=A0A1J0REM3_9VIRU|nr:ORF122 [Anguillid herpesvirus 1]QRM17068.1 protein ORF122 [Anguillid herpesvirus 1]